MSVYFPTDWTVASVIAWLRNRCLKGKLMFDGNLYVEVKP